MRQRVSPLAEVLFAAIATSLDPSADAYERGVTAAERYGFVSLRVYFATECLVKSSDARSANELGRAYQAVGLTSLAYQKYMEAGERGSAVGWINAAQLLGNGDVPAAGLALLARHKGDWENALVKPWAKFAIDVPDGESLTLQLDGRLRFPLPMAAMPLVRLIHVEANDDVTVALVCGPDGAVGAAYSLTSAEFEPRWVQIREFADVEESPHKESSQ